MHKLSTGMRLMHTSREADPEVAPIVRPAQICRYPEGIGPKRCIGRTKAAGIDAFGPIEPPLCASDESVGRAAVDSSSDYLA
jgi:hypothetical protein